MNLSAVLLGLIVSIAVFSETQAGDFQTTANTLVGRSWLQELVSGTSNNVHSRKRRFIQFPKATIMEVKWSINFPYDTYSEYKAKWQVAFTSRLPFPAPFYVARSLKGRPDHVSSEDFNHNSLDYRNDTARIPDVPQSAARREKTAIYKNLEGAFEKVGGHGRHCLLRAICDIAEAPFDQGFVGEMINSILTASIVGHPEDPEESEEYESYLQAELHGKLHGDCAQRYVKCKVSPFDVVPKLLKFLV
ncbi:uncharacterized protein LOC135200529 [Macrobrachium nipponense]|uniref:uncharacterized protein LOC135200529 n=1 Tax=Macrobrachium nipponense TaxID=159736 RepID=UPI0030C825AF